jgi:Xaa-Pro aminopeptidase
MSDASQVVAARLERLRREMLAEKEPVEALLVACAVEDVFHHHSANRQYITGFTGSTGYALITPEEARLAVDFRYVEQARQQAACYTLVDLKGKFGSWFPELIRGLGGKKLSLSVADTSYSLLNGIQKAIGEMDEAERPQVRPAPPLLERLRARKDAAELAALERAIEIGDQAFESVAQTLQAGMTEKQVAWEIEKAARDLGASGMSFETIVGGGPWGALPHAFPRDEPLPAHQPIVIDMGVIYDGYCSDLTRTIVLGEPDETFNRVYDIVLAAQLAAEELIESGMNGRQVHELAEAVIREAGHGDDFGHGLGHGVGLQIHELPRITPFAEDTDVVEDGMVLTIEPGIYLRGWGGVRIEDIVVMENGKARVLTTARKGRDVAVLK